MSIEFTYHTKKDGENTVTLSNVKISGFFIVEIMPKLWMENEVKYYEFNKYDNALKKFNSIKNKMLTKII